MRTFLPTTLAALLGTTALADAPRVAVDIAPVHSIVAAVMEGVGTPDLIVAPGASPHGYSMRPSEARALDEADLVVWMGHGLTPWIEGPIDSLAGDAEKIELLELDATLRLDIREGATFAAHDHDHGSDGHDDHGEEEAGDDDHGHEEAGHDEHDHDDHGHEEAGHDDHAHEDGVDPHAWLDPKNAIAWAAAIADELAHLDPENAQVYADNAAKFQYEINDLIEDIDASMHAIENLPFVVFHDAYLYFETRFGLSAVGAISASDAEDPSPRRLAGLREEIAELGAVCALTEPQFNSGIVNALGDVKTAEIDPLGVSIAPGPDHYATVIRNMAASLEACAE